MTYVGIAGSATGGLSHQVHGERAGFINEAWDLECLDLLEKAPEQLVDIRLAEFAERDGFEGAEVIIWLIIRSALSGKINRLHTSTYAPSVTNIATAVWEDTGSSPSQASVEAYRAHISHELAGAENLAGT